MCDVVNLWRELIVEYNKLKTIKKFKEDLEKTDPKSSKLSLLGKPHEEWHPIEEWLHNNKEYAQNNEDILQFSGEDIEDFNKIQESPLINTMPRKKKSNSNVRKEISISQTIKEIRTRYTSEENIKSKKIGDAKIRPHTAHIFTPPDLNVSFINPIPWKNG